MKHWRAPRRMSWKQRVVLIIKFFPQELPTNCWFGSLRTRKVLDRVVQVQYINFNLKWLFIIYHENLLKHRPTIFPLFFFLSLQSITRSTNWEMLSCFNDQKMSSYPKIFDLHGENSTHSSQVSCPGSFQWIDQSISGAGAEAGL